MTIAMVTTLTLLTVMVIIVAGLESPKRKKSNKEVIQFRTTLQQTATNYIAQKQAEVQAAEASQQYR